MKGAIFDMDGLLFDTEFVWQMKWHELADEMGIVLKPEFGKEICGTSGERRYRVLEKFYPVQNGKPLSDECVRRVEEHLKKEVVEKPGVHEILEGLREKGYRMAVASSSEKDMVIQNLTKAGILSFFEQIVAGKEIPNGKPAPDIFLKAAEKLGLKPEECYVFEDAYTGVTAGYRAGCKVIMVPDTQPATEEMRNMTVAVCTTLNEALDWIIDDNM